MWLIYFYSAIHCLISNPSNQQNNPNYFEKHGIEGAIFSVINVPELKKYSSESLSVSIDDILAADSVAFNYIVSKKYSHSHLIGGGEGCPRIYDEWYSYYRQVVSYRDSITKNEIIYLHYVYKSEVKVYFPDWQNQWVRISGGCTNYFSIVYDKTNNEIIQWGTN
jgi:hypothetical protein